MALVPVALTVSLLVLLGGTLGPTRAALEGGSEVIVPAGNSPYQEFNVSLPGYAPHAVAWDPSAGRLLVTETDQDQLLALSPADGSLLAHVTVGQDPSGVAVDPTHEQVYVANPDDSSVSILTLQDLSTIATVGVGGGPYAIAVDPTLGEGFVPLRDVNKVGAVDAAGLVGSASVGSLPVDVAVDAQAGLVFVLNGGASSVSVLWAKNLTTVDTFPVAAQPTGITVDPSNHLLFVTSDTTGQLVDYNESSGAEVGAVGVGPGLGRVAICPLGGELAVSSTSGNFVALVGESSLNVQYVLPTPDAPFGVAFDGACDSLAVADFASAAVTLFVPPTSATVATVVGTVSPSQNATLSIGDMSVLLSPSGGFSDAVPAGTYWVNASGPGESPYAHEVTLPAGKVTRLTIQLNAPPVPLDWLPYVLDGALGGMAVLAAVLLVRWNQERRRPYRGLAKDDPLRKLLLEEDAARSAKPEGKKVSPPEP